MRNLPGEVAALCAARKIDFLEIWKAALKATTRDFVEEDRLMRELHRLRTNQSDGMTLRAIGEALALAVLNWDEFATEVGEASPPRLKLVNDNWVVALEMHKEAGLGKGPARPPSAKREPGRRPKRKAPRRGKAEPAARDGALWALPENPHPRWPALDADRDYDVVPEVERWAAMSGVRPEHVGMPVERFCGPPEVDWALRFVESRRADPYAPLLPGLLFSGSDPGERLLGLVGCLQRNLAAARIVGEDFWKDPPSGARVLVLADDLCSLADWQHRDVAKRISATLRVGRSVVVWASDEGRLKNAALRAVLKRLEVVS